MEENTKPEAAEKPDDVAPLKGAARIEAYLKTLPDRPGVYRMLNAKSEVLYVGKASSLKKRVSAYAKPLGHPYRIQRMISETAEMIFISTFVSVISAAPCAILWTRSTSSFMPGRSRARIE